MPDVTDCLLLPFPLNTDDQDVPRDIEALAQRVDDLLCGATGDIDGLKTDVNNRVKKAGDTMTGTLIANATGPGISLRRPGNQPYIEFSRHPDGATRYGYVQGLPAMMSYEVEDAAGVHRWLNGPTTETMRLSGGGILDVNQVRTDVRLTAGAPSGGQLMLVDTQPVTGAPTVYLAFFINGSVSAPGTRGGWFGYSSTNDINLRNEIAGGDIIMLTAGSGGNITLTPSSQLNLGAAGATKAVVLGDAFMFGKAAVDSAVAGTEIFCGGTSEGMVRSTVTALNVRNFVAHHEGAANADDQYFYYCVNAAGTGQGGIRSIGTTGVEIVSISDYRTKTDLGLVENALDRICALPVHRFTWNANPELGEREGFFAHEAQAVAPYAVSGEKDAVDDDGNMVEQKMSDAALIALLTAAVQELRAEVAELRETCCG